MLTKMMHLAAVAAMLTTSTMLPIACARAATSPVAAVLEDNTAVPSNGKHGWFWYEDKAPAEKKLPTEGEKPASASPSPQRSEQDTADLARFKDFQRQLEEAQNIATINPSNENMLRFLKLLAETRRMAYVFTDVGRRVATVNPVVDDTYNDLQIRPTNPAATRVWDEARRDAQVSKMRALAKTHGIFFFFRSDCQYCHAMAPVLKRFAERYGITVFPVSMDGGGLPEFPNPAVNNGIAGRIVDQIGIPREQFQVPFTVLARPSTSEVIPLGFGAMNEAELSDRIDLLMREAERLGGGPNQTGTMDFGAERLRSVRTQRPSQGLEASIR